MSISLFAKLRFRFNNGRGITGDQIELDTTLQGEADGPLGISEAFKLQEREGFSSRYHTGGYRYDRTFFSDEYYGGEDVELAGVETWNGVVQVISAGGRVGREESNGGPYQLPGLNDGEMVLDISRHGDYLFVGTTENLRVYTIDDVNGSGTLAHTYPVDFLKGVAAPNDHNNRMYLARNNAGVLQLRRYGVGSDGALTHEYSSNITIATLNTALGTGEQSIVNIGQLKAISVFDTRLWVYAQRSNDIKIVNIDDVTNVFAAAPVPVVTTSGAGTGAVIDTFVVGADGAITDIVWDDGGSGYAAGDTITLAQGAISATYTLQAADLNGGALVDFTGTRIVSGQFAINVDFDHEAGRLQDITGATRSQELEIVSSRFVVNLFTQAGENRPGNYRGNTLSGSLYDPADPLNVRDPWAGVNPSDLSAVLVAENVGRPVYWRGQVWYVDAHPHSAHDAVIAFAEPINGDFPAGYRWRGSVYGALDSNVANPQENDVAYSIDLGRLERRVGGLWRSWDYDRFLGPGPASSESHARVRVAASSQDPKVGLLVAWDGHGLRRVSAYTPAVAMTITYDLHVSTNDFGDSTRTYLYTQPSDLPASTGRRDGDIVMVAADNVAAPAGVTFRNRLGVALTVLSSGQQFRYSAANADYRIFLDGRYPWLAINPTQTELTAILVAGNLGRPVLLHDQVWVVHQTHHDGIDAVVTFEDPPANVFGAVYNFRGSIPNAQSYPSNPQHQDVIYNINLGRLERYNNTYWAVWNESLFLGRADTEADAIARVDRSPVTPKTSLVVAWRGSELRKVETYTAGTAAADVIDLVPTGVTADDVRRIIDEDITFVTAEADGSLRTPTAADWDVDTAQSKVVGWAYGKFWKVRRDLISAHTVSATFTEVTDTTAIGGRRWREYHYQDYLVENVADNDVYINRHGYVWRIRTGGRWRNLDRGDAWFDDNNVIRDTYASEDEALQHVSSDGQYVGYVAGGNPRLYLTSAVVTNDEHYVYVWADAILDEITETVRANSISVEERAALQALTSRVPRRVILTLGDFQANIPGYDPENDVGSSTSAIPGEAEILSVAFVTSGDISGTDGTNKVYIITSEGSGEEAYDGAIIIWNDPDDAGFTEYTLEAIAYIVDQQRYLTTTVVTHRPAVGDEAVFNIEDVHSESVYDFAFEDHEKWLWHRGQLGR